MYISHFFVQHGYAVFRYDKRGTGESTGKFQGVGIEDGEDTLNDLAIDALAGVEFLKNHNLINPTMNGLMGISQAGWIIPLAASKSPDVAFAISWSGPTCTLGQELYYSDLTAEGIPLKEASNRARDYMGPHGFDPVPSLQKLDIPGLWLFGGQDSSIPVPLTAEILDSLVTDHEKDFSYNVYPNENHVLVDEDTHGSYPIMLDALNWQDETFRE